MKTKKMFFFPVIGIIMIFCFFTSCEFPNEDKVLEQPPLMNSRISSVALPHPSLEQIKAGPFMGGSLIESTAVPGVSQIREGMWIPFRLGVLTLDGEAGGKGTEYVDNPGKAKYGYLLFKSVSDSFLEFEYVIFASDGKVMREGWEAIKKEEKLDIDNNGTVDLTYTKSSERTSFTDCMYLNFISSRDGLYTTMYSFLPEHSADKRYPSGILGVNNDGKVLFSGNYAMSRKESRYNRASEMTFSNQIAFLMEPGDFVFDTASGNYEKIEAINSSKSKEWAVLFEQPENGATASQEAISLLYFEYEGTLADLEYDPEDGYESQLDDFYDDLADYPKRYAIFDESYQFSVDLGNNNEFIANIERLKTTVGLKIEFSISWTKIVFKVDAALLADAAATFSVTGPGIGDLYKHMLSEKVFSIGLGIFSISFKLPLEFGIEVESTFNSGLEINTKGAAYFEKGVGVTMGWGYITPYHFKRAEFISDFEVNADHLAEGSLTVNPYLEYSPRISILGLYAEFAIRVTLLGVGVSTEREPEELVYNGVLFTEGKLSFELGINWRPLFNYSKEWLLWEWYKILREGELFRIDRIPPVAPRIYYMLPEFNDGIIIIWFPSTDNSGFIDHYLCSVNPYPPIRKFPFRAPVKIPGDQNTYAMRGLQPGSTYSIRLQAVDSSGNKSSWSSPEIVTIPSY